MAKFHPAIVIPNSIRIQTVTSVTTYITIQCSQCGHQFETYVDKYHQAAKCRGCNRLCSFGLEPETADTNVIPFRKARTHG